MTHVRVGSRNQTRTEEQSIRSNTKFGTGRTSYSQFAAESARDSGDAIRVIARFRPFNGYEKQITGKKKLKDFTNVDYRNESVVEINNPQVKNSGRYAAKLDRIFNSDTSQLEIYQSAACLTVADVLKGYNGTIFTYGQSGSGKTFSMYGSDIYDEESKGIVPRAVFSVKQRPYI